MSDQSATETTVQRDEGGRLLPGSVLNPDGLGGNADGWQPYGKRCRYWLTKLTRGELKKLATDEEAMDKLSSYDSMIVAHLARTQAGKEISRERAQLLAYIEGMPVQTIQTTELTKPITSKEIDAMTDDEAVAAYESIIKR